MRKKTAKKKQVARPVRRKPVLRKATDQKDIVELMLRDHRSLKLLIRTLKDPGNELELLHKSFDEFAPLLTAHAHPEQESLYAHLEGDEKEELRIRGFHSHAEHAIADQLVHKIKTLDDDDEWRATVAVLAELVENHIKVEEGQLIPSLRDELELDERVEIGIEYLRRRATYGFVEEGAVA